MAPDLQIQGRAGLAEETATIVLVLLPRYAPKLNLQEQVWR